MKYIDRSSLPFGRSIFGVAVAATLAACGGSDGGSDSTVSSAQIPCESLIGKTLDGGGVVNTAEEIPAGSYTPPNLAPYEPSPLTSLPAFCRVTVTKQTSPDSSVDVEVWLPKANWNGRFLGTGNGGPAGAITYYTGLREGLIRGFAVANSDLGTARDITTREGHPEKWKDFGYRATREMTLAGKSIVNAYYQTSPRYSYFQGCSTGGQEALTHAQRYPTDYNGIIVGAPGNNRTHLNMSFIWNHKALTAPGATLTPGKAKMVQSKSVAACVGKDGGSPTDTFLTDPRQCNFDPKTLPVCAPGADGDDCLTAPQLAAVEKWYAGPTNPRTGERILSGVPFGSEALLYGLADQSASWWPAQQFYPFYWIFGKPYDHNTFDFDQDVERIDDALAPILNANNPDLSAFKANGGKMIMYTGAQDPAVVFPEAIKYYERVVTAQGGDLTATQSFFRYYLVPGMGHCSGLDGGDGGTEFGQPYSAYVPTDPQGDILIKMTDWVEKQEAPEEIIGTRFTASGQIATQRPICVYPKLPKYLGGDPNKAGNFVCQDGPRGSGPATDERYLNK
ncbi:tannase/feruloyl esterase family alpha/beta hydrolase [Ramlibacter sp. 2FC]|uniref:tannase/feruloyl esterase family alpha/beta hydrolase n=1 Tax=Ramlibacter sp. 2FC TaxID=2502188 RepID=UPI0010F76459|nr:tannase/feruloyl esterase family alpha/beta hydrolase [Ramlibacter sp. 2FC]